MMKFCKGKLKNCESTLKENLTNAFKCQEIKSYTDLLRIVSNSLELRLFNDNIVEIQNYEHVMLITNFGSDYEDYIMTFVYDHHSSGESDLSVILHNEDEEKIINELFEQCELLINNMITPYITDVSVFKNKVGY